MANLKVSEQAYPSTRYTEGAEPSTPAAGEVIVYAKAAGLMYSKDDAGVETALGAGAAGAVATDAIWDAAGDLAVGSGANTAAKLTMGAEGSALTVMDGVVGWNSATSMPGSPTTGQRVWRSDLALEFYFDGTRWLTTTLYNLTFGNMQAVAPWAATTAMRTSMPHETLDMWALRFWASTFVATTSSGSQYWTITLDNTSTVLSTISNTANALTIEAAAVNASIATGTQWLTLSITKVSTPGTLFADPRLSYRLIGV